MRRAREAIVEDRYPEFVKQYFHTLYSGEKEEYPRWAVGALRRVDVDLMSD